jgi:hypothetical protein
MRTVGDRFVCPTSSFTSPSLLASLLSRAARLHRFGKCTAFVVALVGGTFARTAQARADVCVEIDTQRDNLSESDRAAARTMLEQALEQQGQRVVPAPCQNAYYAYNVRLGSSVTAVVSGANASRSLRLRSVEDIPAAYTQIVESLLSGKPIAPGNETIDRNNVTDTQTSPNRVEADSLWYLRLGFGGVVGGGLTTGPSFGFGWRHELDRLAIDASFLNFTLTQKDNSSQNFSGSLLKLMGLYYFDPFANSSLYAGTGLSWGASSVVSDSREYDNSGLHGELSLGYEMLRASNIRIFAQLDASLPFYLAHAAGDLNGDLQPTPSASLYTPTFALSIGLGWGRSNTIRVRNIN